MRIVSGPRQLRRELATRERTPHATSRYRCARGCDHRKGDVMDDSAKRLGGTGFGDAADVMRHRWGQLQW